MLHFTLSTHPMKQLHFLPLAASMLLMSSCRSTSQDPVPTAKKPEVVVRYSAVGADTVFTLVQIRTFPHAKPDSTAYSSVQAMMGFKAGAEWWVGNLPAKYDVVASVLVPPCGARRKVMPPGASLTLDIVVDKKVLRTVKIESGATLYTPPIQTDISLNGLEIH
jgi:hypothetical protein